MLELIIHILFWIFLAIYALKMVLTGLKIARMEYPQKLIREKRDDLFSATFYTLLFICLLLYNLGVV